MGKPIVRDFTQGKGILKFFPYEGAACLVPQTMKSTADENGNKIEMLEEMNQTVFRLQEDAVQIGLNIQIKKLESFSMIPLLLSAIIIILFSLFIFQTIGVENLV